ncbi:MAG: MauE/DoxX family redox-associated membrane protein [Acidobacteriota bacterium]
MELLVLIARLGLAAVLGVAGGTKIAGLSRTREMLGEFGVGAGWIPSLALLLPIAEIITAAAMLWQPLSLPASLAALLLFLTFTAGMAYNLALGRRPECNCFGQLHSRRIGASTLVRNVLLLAASIFIVLEADASRAAGLSTGTRLSLVTILVLGTSLLVVARLVLDVIRLNEYLEKRLDEFEEFLSSETFQSSGNREPLSANDHLPIGAPAPDFALTNLDGEHVALNDLLAPAKPLLVFFLSSDCGPCGALIPEIDLWRYELNNRFSFAIISRGSVQSNREKFAKASRRPSLARSGTLSSLAVLVDERAVVANEYRAKWTPAAILVTSASTIGSQVAFGDQQIKALLDSLIESDDEEPRLSPTQSRVEGFSSRKASLKD